jgi:hypothetical protein
MGLDERTYDFKLYLKHHTEDNWHQIIDKDSGVLQKRKSWQVISLGDMRPRNI